MRTRLAGTGFTAQLWGIGGVTSDEHALLLADRATTTFRTGAGAGFIMPLEPNALIQNAPAGLGSRSTLQVRVWDNQGGTVLTWEEAVLAWERGEIVIGKSELFVPPFDLGGGIVVPPNLIGLTSFQLYPNLAVQTPEPNAVIFLVIASLCGLRLRTQK